MNIAEHNGIFHKQISLFEAVALILSGTIGAGILSIPYAVAKSGLLIGIIYIIGLGILMISLNTMLGFIAVNTAHQYQLPGLAKVYLGKYAGYIMSAISYLMFFSVLVVFIIGEGNALSALFGGSEFYWSIIFFLFASIFTIFGLRTVKVAELFLMFGILFVVVILSFIAWPQTELAHYSGVNLQFLALPYGVILFAFYGAASIPEAYSLLKNRETDFKRAIRIAGAIVILVYLLFTLLALGVTGEGTTEIATIGLGAKLGRSVNIFGNIFAALIMGTSFLMSGISLRDSLSWDYSVKPWLATTAVCVLPISIFLLGMREFIGLIDIIGGVFVSAELLMIILIYFKVRKKIGLKGKRMMVSLWLISLFIVALAIGTIYSIIKII
ncbi:MAG: aromatic amino acid transport family protein [Patescibacteria group bacterium]